MSCENELVDWNICDIRVTELTFQFEMSALKAAQPLNKPCMSVTELTSQRDKSAANVDRMLDERDPKRLFILVTLLTSQSDMTPYVLFTVPYVVQLPMSGSSVKQELIASEKVASVIFTRATQVLKGPLTASEQIYLRWNWKAPKNMSTCADSVALPLHAKMYPANDDALENIEDMLVTLPVFQEEISPLKDVACSNALSMFVTLEVSHIERDAPNLVVTVP